jgi:hypothetical protein
MTSTWWVALAYGAALLVVAFWQVFVAFAAADLAAHPRAVGDLRAGASRARRWIAVLCLGRGLATYALAAVVSGLGVGAFSAAAGGSAGRQAAVTSTASSAPWAPALGAVLALSTTMYFLTRVRPDRGDVSLKPWLARVLPFTLAAVQENAIKQHLDRIRRHADEAQQFTPDEAADQALRALAHVVALPPDVLARRLSAIAVSAVHSPRRRRNRVRAHREFAPVLGRLMDKYRDDVEADQPDAEARSFWYLAMLRELADYAGGDAIDRLVAGLPLPSGGAVTPPPELTTPIDVINLPQDSASP